MDSSFGSALAEGMFLGLVILCVAMFGLGCLAMWLVPKFFHWFGSHWH